MFRKPNIIIFGWHKKKVRNEKSKRIIVEIQLAKEDAFALAEEAFKSDFTEIEKMLKPSQS